MRTDQCVHDASDADADVHILTRHKQSRDIQFHEGTLQFSIDHALIADVTQPTGATMNVVQVYMYRPIRGIARINVHLIAPTAKIDGDVVASADRFHHAVPLRGESIDMLGR